MKRNLNLISRLRCRKVSRGEPRQAHLEQRRGIIKFTRAKRHNVQDTDADTDTHLFEMQRETLTDVPLEAHTEESY